MSHDYKVILADHKEIISVDQFHHIYSWLSEGYSIARALYFLDSYGWELKDLKVTTGNYGQNGIHYSYYLYIFTRTRDSVTSETPDQEIPVTSSSSGSSSSLASSSSSASSGASIVINV